MSFTGHLLAGVVNVQIRKKLILRVGVQYFEPLHAGLISFVVEFKILNHSTQDKIITGRDSKY